MSNRYDDKKKQLPSFPEEVNFPDKEEVRGKRDPKKKKNKHHRDKDDLMDNWN